jgi:hypothetical protein
LHAHVAQDSGSYTVALTHETKQQVLGANVIMVEALGFLLGKLQHLAGSFREFVKLVCHALFSRRPLARAVVTAYLPGRHYSFTAYANHGPSDPSLRPYGVLLPYSRRQSGKIGRRNAAPADA